MKSDEIIVEIEDLFEKIKMKLLYFETENIKLKKRIQELKKYVKEK